MNRRRTMILALTVAAIVWRSPAFLSADRPLPVLTRNLVGSLWPRPGQRAFPSPSARTSASTCAIALL